MYMALTHTYTLALDSTKCATSLPTQPIQFEVLFIILWFN